MAEKATSARQPMLGMMIQAMTMMNMLPMPKNACMSDR